MREPLTRLFERPTLGKGGGGYTFVDTDAKAYVAAMAVQPDDARKAAIDAFYVRGKVRSYWSKLDWMSLYASHDAQASRINLKNPAQIASIVGAPTFVADKGWAGDASNYIDTGINLSTAGGGYTRNSAHVGVWNMTSAAASGAGAYIEMDAAGVARFYTNYSNLLYVSMNAAQVSFSNITSLGHVGWSRTGSTAASVFRHGGVLATSAGASTGVPNASIITGRSPRRCGLLHYGAGLTDAEWADFHADYGLYLNESGILPAFDVFLVIGDSNNHAGPTYNAAIDTVSPRVWAHQRGLPGNGGGEEPIRSVAPNWYSGSNVGYDVAFLRDFYIPNDRLSSGRIALIVKASGGGTGLFTTNQEWRPTKTGYVDAVTQANEVLATYPGASLKGILGIVGANDATVSADATQFETQYDLMLAGLRANIAGASAVPIVMGGMPPTYLGVNTASALQAKIAAVGSRFVGAGYADPSSPTVINDNTDAIHYTAQGQRGTLGNPGGMAGRFWTGYLAALSDP